MDKKIHEIININKISMDILKQDLIALKSLEHYGYSTPDYFANYLNELENNKTIVDVLNNFGELFDRLAKEEQWDLAIILQQFLQRYAYFAATNNDYLNYSDTINSSVLNDNNLADIFTAIYTPFFGKQIDFYTTNFLDNISSYNLIEWNESFYNEIKDELGKILKEQDFLIKLELVEKFTGKYANPEYLYNLIKIDWEKPNPEKEGFATQFNEYKVTLQSIDLMIEKTINEIKQIIEED